MRHIFEGQVGTQIIGSGSKGNAVLIYDDKRAFLVDAGLSGRELIKRLDGAGFELERLAGVILTHEHDDHTRGLKGLLKKIDVPVWANIQTSDYLKSRGYQKVKWQVFDTGSEFSFDGIKVKSFPVPHDAYDPCGFVVCIGEISVGILTDLGYCTDIIRREIASCQVLVLEANYDDELLAQDQKRPWSVKQRISARHGHLSNVQAAELLRSLVNRNCKLRHVFLAHMSEDCNSPELAITEVRKGLAEAGLEHVEVHLSYQSHVSDDVVI